MSTSKKMMMLAVVASVAVASAQECASTMKKKPCDNTEGCHWDADMCMMDVEEHHEEPADMPATQDQDHHEEATDAPATGGATCATTMKKKACNNTKGCHWHADMCNDVPATQDQDHHEGTDPGPPACAMDCMAVCFDVPDARGEMGPNCECIEANNEAGMPCDFGTCDDDTWAMINNMLDDDCSSDPAVDMGDMGGSTDYSSNGSGYDPAVDMGDMGGSTDYSSNGSGYDPIAMGGGSNDNNTSGGSEYETTMNSGGGSEYESTMNSGGGACETMGCTEFDVCYEDAYGMAMCELMPTMEEAAKNMCAADMMEWVCSPNDADSMWSSSDGSNYGSSSMPDMSGSSSSSSSNMSGMPRMSGSSSTSSEYSSSSSDSWSGPGDRRLLFGGAKADDAGEDHGEDELDFSSGGGDMVNYDNCCVVPAVW